MGDNDATPDSATALDEGLAYRYPARAARRLPIAPSHGEITNTVVIHPWPSPTACVRLDNERFSFDSSFPHPTLSADLARLFEMRPPGGDGEKLAIFGHADPVGTDAYNKVLSGRRAKAIYALLTRNPEMWDELHQQPYGGDRWGIESLHDCLTRLGYDSGTDRDHASPQYEEAMHAFEDDHGLPRTMQRDTRLALFGAYMDSLAGAPPGATRAYAPSDFVGEGRTPDHRGAFQGCGERNPAMVVSRDEDAELAKPDNHERRNAVQAANRRVLVFLYARDDVRDMGRWECPSAKAGPSSCDKVKWSDKDERLTPGKKRREVRRHGKTFGCRFYDFTARLSPCEALKGTLRVWIRNHLGNRYAQPVDYELRASGIVRTGTTDGDGKLEEADIPVDTQLALAWKEPPLTPPRPGVELAFALPVSDAEGDDSSPPLGAPPAPAGAAPVPSERVGVFRGDYTHFAQIYFPPPDVSQERRTKEWLHDLGYASAPTELRPSLQRFARDYGLKVGVTHELTLDLLTDVHATGREAHSAAPVVLPRDGDDATPSATVQPPCCKNAPTVAWTQGTSTFVSPNGWLTVAAKRTAEMSSDLLFELPLYDGQFLYKGFNAVKRPIRDSATGLWKRDHGSPSLPLERDVDVSGVCVEMKNRLDWAQRRLWFRYCAKQTGEGKTADESGFKTWLRTDQKVIAQHLTLRNEGTQMSMHGSGAAIDVGASDTPFICVRGKDRIVGEAHSKVDLPKLPPFSPDGTLTKAENDARKSVDDNFRKKVNSTQFYEDNAFEPALAGFDRATKLMLGTPAVMTVGKDHDRFHALPGESPCEARNVNSDHADEIAKVWDRFDEVNRSWKQYVAASSESEFNAQVIGKAKLAGTVEIDDDLLAFAKTGTAAPTTYALQTEPDGPYRKKRKRTGVTLADLTGKPEIARAAYFQMLRDRDAAAMIMVKGKLGGAPAGTTPKNWSQQAPVLRIPCAWPDGFEVLVPATRDVRNGFLGIGREVVAALVEAGLIWLGGTGDWAGEPIQDFTGDIMHFDLRTVYKIGSAEMDAWLDENVARQAWQAKLGTLHTAVGAGSTAVRIAPSSPSLRQSLAAGGYGALEDASPDVAELDKSATSVSTALPSTSPDDALAAIMASAKSSFAKLSTARSKKQADFSAKTGRPFQEAEEALSAGFRANTEADVDAAIAKVNAIAVPTLDATGPFIGKYRDALKMGRGLGKSLKSLADKVALRKKPSTDSERKSIEEAAQKFSLSADGVLRDASP